MVKKKEKYIGMTRAQAVSEGLKGNQNAIKLKTDELKKEAYKQYCDHIASGNPKEAWYFEHPELSLTYKTIEKYIRENPQEFPAIQKEKAECASYSKWFETGKLMMLGGVEKCQPVIYQMIMRNKFGWDKETHHSHSFEPDVRKLLAKFENREE